MIYQIEESLENFSAWSGGKDTLDFLIKTGDVDQIDELIEQGIGGETNIPTATDINGIPRLLRLGFLRALCYVGRGR